MKESDIHRTIISYGVLPIIQIIKELEIQERYEDCFILKSAVDTFRSKYDFCFFADKNIETAEEYVDYYENLQKGCGEIAKSNIEYYIKECKEKLKINL